MTVHQKNKIERLLEEYAGKRHNAVADSILDEILEEFYMAGEQDTVVLDPDMVKSLLITFFNKGYDRGKDDYLILGCRN